MTLRKILALGLFTLLTACAKPTPADAFYNKTGIRELKTPNGVWCVVVEQNAITCNWSAYNDE